MGRLHDAYTAMVQLGNHQNSVRGLSADPAAYRSQMRMYFEHVPLQKKKKIKPKTAKQLNKQKEFTEKYCSKCKLKKLSDSISFGDWDYDVCSATCIYKKYNRGKVIQP